MLWISDFYETTTNFENFENYTKTIRVFYCYAECHYAECLYAEYLYAHCLHAECLYAKCFYAECLYAECLYALCHYAECCRLNVVAPMAMTSVEFGPKPSRLIGGKGRSQKVWKESRPLSFHSMVLNLRPKGLIGINPKTLLEVKLKENNIYNLKLSWSKLKGGRQYRAFPFSRTSCYPMALKRLLIIFLILGQ
jgi:hypothetical protein